VFLAANLHAHSYYTQRFPKGLHKGRTLEKKKKTTKERGGKERRGKSGGNWNTKGLARAEPGAKKAKYGNRERNTKSDRLQS
jgi:hypothetical protein